MSIWTKLFTLPSIEPIVPLPRFDFTPIQRPTATELLVAILDDSRVPDEVRLEYYAKFVGCLARPSGIIKFNGPLAGNEAWETCTESVKASRTEERIDGKKSENL